WTHTYQKDTSQFVWIRNVIPLADGRIVIGAQSAYVAVDDTGRAYFPYYHYTPWFLLLDSLGNILTDTLYGDKYMLDGSICNSLYDDKNGGYIHIGTYDTVVTPFSTDDANFPAYIAHLDTNFRITWITEFTYSATYGHQQAGTVVQLQDSSYLAVGETA